MKISRLLLTLAGITIFTGLAFALFLYRELNAPVTHSQEEQWVEIPRGSSPTQVVSKLNSLGVIRREWPLWLYFRFTGAGSRLKAGEYRFDSPISPLEVVKKLEEGEERLSRMTVVEGWTRWDVAALMARIPELGISQERALALMDDTSLISDLDPKAQNLEGYLFPDTYSFRPNTKPEEIIATMVRRFREVWAQVQNSHGPPNRPVYEVVTIASLIETEAKLKEERPIVSSVIFNRLERGLPLGIDSTIVYASKLAGKWRNDGKVYLSDVERVSPYNTRKVAGLPPGPVASPGRSSLEAALRPASTGYLYYVRDPSRDDGAHNFYEDAAEFQKGVQALREWERTRDANAQPAERAKPAPEGSSN